MAEILHIKEREPPLGEPDADHLGDLADQIRVGYGNALDGERKWVAGTLQLSEALATARSLFRANRDFHHWLKEFDFLSHDDRAALIGMGQNLGLAKTTLVKTESRSWRLIWQEMQEQLDPARAGRRVRSAAKTETQGASESIIAPERVFVVEMTDRTDGKGNDAIGDEDCIVYTTEEAARNYVADYCDGEKLPWRIYTEPVTNFEIDDGEATRIALDHRVLYDGRDAEEEDEEEPARAASPTLNRLGETPEQESKRLADLKASYDGDPPALDRKPEPMLRPDFARRVVEYFSPHFRAKDTLYLDPCCGPEGGGFIDALPPEKRDWCEISRGRDFFAWTKKVSWIFGNPPWSADEDLYRRFMRHAFEVADNVVVLVMLGVGLGTSAKIRDYRNAGHALREIIIVRWVDVFGQRQRGETLALLHWQRDASADEWNWSGKVKLSYWDEPIDDEPDTSGA